MRILHVIPSVNLKGGGPIEWVKQVCPVLVDQGHECEVVSLDAENDPWVSAFPIPTHALGPSQPDYRYTKSLIPWLRKNAFRYDAVISHGLWQYSSVGVWKALKGAKTPYFVCPHGMLDPWFKRTYPLKHLKKILYWLGAEYRVLRDTAAILYTSEEERRLAGQSFRPCGNEVVTPLGTAAIEADSQSYQVQFLARYPGLRGKRIWLYLSRIHPKKGCDLLIEAFAAVVSEAPDYHLVIAGPDSSGWLAALQQRTEQLGIADRVTWIGMVSGDEKLAALFAAEAFILPSHQETFPISITEATACGIPVLTTFGVNTWREIKDSGAGLVAKDDVPGITQLLRDWLSLSSDQQNAMREGAKACFARYFEINQAAKSLVTVLRANGVEEQHTVPIANPSGEGAAQAP